MTVGSAHPTLSLWVVQPQCWGWVVSLTLNWLPASILPLVTDHSISILIFLKYMLGHIQLQIKSLATINPNSLMRFLKFSLIQHQITSPGSLALSPVTQPIPLSPTSQIPHSTTGPSLFPWAGCSSLLSIHPNWISSGSFSNLTSPIWVILILLQSELITSVIFLQHVALWEATPISHVFHSVLLFTRS